MASKDPVFISVLDTSAWEVHPPKKQKGEEGGQKEETYPGWSWGLSNLGGKLKIDVMAKDFPYPDFMNKELMIPVSLEKL